jgi:hypothetical protein
LGVWRGANNPTQQKNILLRKSKKGKSWMDLMMMERVGDRWEKMEGSYSTGQSPQWSVVPVEEEEEDGTFITDISSEIFGSVYK